MHILLPVTDNCHSWNNLHQSYEAELGFELVTPWSSQIYNWLCYDVKSSAYIALGKTLCLLQIVDVFLIYLKHMCNVYPQHMFSWKNMKNIYLDTSTPYPQLWDWKVYNIWYLFSQLANANIMQQRSPHPHHSLWVFNVSPTPHPLLLGLVGCFRWFGVSWPSQHYYGHVEPISLPNHTFPGQA